MRARKEGARDFGACMSPQNAFLILQGMETLHVRMPRHVENTLQIANFLEQHDMVNWVSYPGLPSHTDYDLAQRLLPKGCGGVLSFEVDGGRSAGQLFIERLQLFSHLANIGDAKSLVIHPASTTHHRMDAAALQAAGISEGLIRLSIGIEDKNDLINDLKAALSAVRKKVRACAC